MQRKSLATSLPAAFGVCLLGAAVALAGTPIDETVPARSDSEVKIENLAGSVTVTVGSDDQVRITGTLGENAKRLDVKTDDEDVHIQVVLPRRVENIAGTDLVVEVPKGAELAIETVSADVSVEGVEGKVDVETVSGETGIRVPAGAGRLRLESVSGPVTVSGEIEDLRAESVSGRIDIEGADGEVEASTTNGDIRVVGGKLADVEIGSVSGAVTLDGDPASGGEVEIENLSGSVTVRLSADANAEIRVETLTGKVDSDFEGSTVGEEDGRGEWLRTVVGDGSASVRISTFSGPVEIRKR